MGLQLLNTFSADRETSQASDEASINDLFGQINRERIFFVNDSKGKLNPYAPGGFLNVNPWRNGRAVQTDSSGRKTFDGVINDVAFRDDGARSVIITARDQFAYFAELPVEELLLVSDSSFVTNYYALQNNQAQGATGNIQLNVTGAPAGITAPAFVAFGLRNVPRYSIQVAAGGPPTTQIRLDRGLELAETAGTKLRVMQPGLMTPAKALRNALTGAGLASRLSASFARYEASDTADNNLLWVFVRKENDIKLLQHMKTILEMFDMYLTVDNTTGVIDIFRGFEYTGGAIDTEVTDSELLDSIELKDNKTNHTFGYQCLYLNGAGVSVAAGTTTAANLNRWAPVKNFVPLDAKGQSILDYQYLYNNSTTAHRFGARRAAYYGVPRVRANSGLKLHRAGRPRALYNLTLGKEVLLTVTLATGKRLYREPARCTAFNYDEVNLRYASAEFELTNYRYPQRPKP